MNKHEETFKDYYQNDVILSFDDHPFSKHPMHVWVICRFHHQWLLTKHPRRGWEFPGGKVEPGESAYEAGIREVFEETGAHAKEMIYIGQYKVEGKSETIVKNVYYAIIDEIKLKDHYMETDGPVFLSYIPDNIRKMEKYSFMMKDDVLPLCMAKISEYKKKALLKK